MDQPPRQEAVLIGVIALVVLGALVLRTLVSRGKSLTEGLVGIGSGIAGAIVMGGIAHLSGDPPVWAATVLPTPEAWTAACAAFGAMFGDRVAVGVLVEARRFGEDPQAWASRWFPWLRRAGK